MPGYYFGCQPGPRRCQLPGSGVLGAGCWQRRAYGRAEPQRRWAQRGPRLLPGPGPGGDSGLPGAPGFGSTAWSCAPSSLSAPSDVTPPLGPGFRKRKYLVEKNTVSFQPVSEPLLEKMLLSSFISRANHLPRCQELRPGEIKYPIILSGRAGRGGEAGTRTKHSLESACSHQITPREAREGPLSGARDVSLQLRDDSPARVPGRALRGPPGAGLRVGRLDLGPTRPCAPPRTHEPAAQGRLCSGLSLHFEERVHLEAGRIMSVASAPGRDLRRRLSGGTTAPHAREPRAAPRRPRRLERPGEAAGMRSAGWVGPSAARRSRGEGTSAVTRP